MLVVQAGACLTLAAPAKGRSIRSASDARALQSIGQIRLVVAAAVALGLDDRQVLLHAPQGVGVRGLEDVAASPTSAPTSPEGNWPMGFRHATSCRPATCRTNGPWPRRRSPRSRATAAFGPPGTSLAAATRRRDREVGRRRVRRPERRLPRRIGQLIHQIPLVRPKVEHLRRQWYSSCNFGTCRGGESAWTSRQNRGSRYRLAGLESHGEEQMPAPVVTDHRRVFDRHLRVVSRKSYATSGAQARQANCPSANAGHTVCRGFRHMAGARGRKQAQRDTENPTRPLAESFMSLTPCAQLTGYCITPAAAGRGFPEQTRSARDPRDTPD